MPRIFSVMRRAPSGLLFLLMGAGCAVPPPVAPPQQPVVVVVPTPPPEPSVPTIPVEPRVDPAEALKRSLALVEPWGDGPKYSEGKRPAFFAEQKLDETTVRRLLAAVAEPCLAQPDGEGAACKEVCDTEKSVGKAAVVLVTMLGELADPAPRLGPSLRLLVRLHGRGHWEAGSAMVRALERRMAGATTQCAPPGVQQIDEARRSLDDLALVTPAPHWPTAAELDDLAYLYAVVGGAGPEVGKAPEDRTAATLPEGHPDLAKRVGLRAEMAAALCDGDPTRHLAAATAYLATLGYPGPLRLGEERDRRWGGSGASYVMREAATSAELIGRYDVAEALYRRANPGGGMCGTSVAYTRDLQTEGVIRAAEQARGCGAVAAERLLAITTDPGSLYDPGRLGSAGFDVPRLYSAALLLAGRDDPAELARALGTLPSRSGEAGARLARLGNEAWATRLRAIAGYADTMHAKALPRLLDLAVAGPVEERVTALDVLARLAADSGWDPCVPTDGSMGWHHMSSHTRAVQGVMGECSSRIDRPVLETALKRIEAMETASEPPVREAVASTLGRLGAARSRPVLKRLAKDTFDAGGQICTTRNGGPEVCGPNRPVAYAAKEALEALRSADETRAEQRAARKRSATAGK